MTCECNNKSMKVVDDIIASDKLIQAAIDDWTAHAGETSSTLTRPGKAEEIGSAVYVPGGGKSVGLIGGTVRVSPAGVPYFINDALHAEIGLTGVRIGALSHELIVDFAHDFSKVGTLQAVVDESLAAYMLQIGGSVERNFATFRLVAPLYFSAKGDGTITSISPLWRDYVTFNASASNANSGHLVFNVPRVPITANQPIISSKTDGGYVSRFKNYSAYSGNGALKIATFSESKTSAYITCDGTNFTVTGAAGVSAVFSGGMITITHPEAGSGAAGRSIQSVKNPNNYMIQTYGNAATSIKVYSETGALKTAIDNTMNFIFNFDASNRTMSLTPLSSSDEFTIFVGYCYVPIEALKNIPTGNIWLMGAMNK